MLPPAEETAIVTADSYADLLERLFGAYENKHSFAVIELVADQCRRELAGQTSPGSNLELLERLARERLDTLRPSQPTR
jgi:hypothetical protein